jgi:asparagine synthase (glutamine-hydrolysing)
VRAAMRAPSGDLATNSVCARLIDEGSAAIAVIPTDRGWQAGPRGLKSYARHAWQEFLFKAEYAFDYGMPQWLARIDNLILARTSHLFLVRHKPYHFRMWYREGLADYVRDVLLSANAADEALVERERVKAVVESHLRGARNHTTELHKLLTIAAIQRLFLRDPVARPSKPIRPHVA